MTPKILLPVLLVPTSILLIPLAAMLLKADGIAWTTFDFAVAWVLIASVVLAYKLITRKAGSMAYSVAAAVGLGAGFLLIWINVAVGVIGSSENPVNLLYAAVLVIGAFTAVGARFEPTGMSWALFATALAQFMVPVVALAIAPHDFSPGVGPVFGLNFIFVLLFAASGLLFRHAAGKPGAHNATVSA